MTLRIAVPELPSPPQRLAELLMPELKVDHYFPDVDDSVLFGARCAIQGCAGSQVVRHGLCGTHRQRAIKLLNRTVRQAAPTFTLSAATNQAFIEQFTQNPELHQGPVAYNHPGFRFDGLTPTLADEFRFYLHLLRVTRLSVARLGEYQLLARLAREARPAPISLFDRPDEEALEYVRSRTPMALPTWLSTYETHERIAPMVRLIKNRLALACYDLPRMERDVWALDDFNLTPRDGSRDSVISFTRFRRPWLKEWLKEYAEYNLKVGLKWVSVRGEITAWQRIERLFDDWEVQQQVRVNSPADISRALLEYLLERVNLGEEFNNYSKVTTISYVRKLLQVHRDLDWKPVLQQGAVIRRNEAARPVRSLPEPIDPYVLTQLLDPEKLARMPVQLANAVVISRHHGLRISSLLTLPYDPLRYSDQGPILRYFNLKLNRPAEQPIMKQEVLDAINRQQQWVSEQLPKGSKWLFPALKMNVDGQRHWQPKTLTEWFERAIDDLNIVNRAGQTPRITWHHFRDTFASELLDAGVPPYVIAALLDHTNTWTLDVYAQQSANAMRRQLDQTPRFDQHGEVLPPTDEGPGDSDAAFMRDSLRLASTTVPNGYCTLPIREECPHMNACYTCPSESFVTTPTHLPGHLKHLEETHMLIVASEARGQSRMVQKNRVTEQHVTRIIQGLLTWVDTHPEDIVDTQLADFLLRNEQELNAIRTRRPDDGEPS